MGMAHVPSPYPLAIYQRAAQEAMVRPGEMKISVNAAAALLAADQGNRRHFVFHLLFYSIFRLSWNNENKECCCRSGGAGPGIPSGDIPPSRASQSGRPCRQQDSQIARHPAVVALISFEGVDARGHGHANEGWTFADPCGELRDDD